MRPSWQKLLYLLGAVALAVVFLLAHPVNPVQEVHIVAESYQFNPPEVKVHSGIPVRLLVTSVDTDHGIAIPSLAVKETATRGRITTVEFLPDQSGRYPFECATECGVGHEEMNGALEVD